MSRASTRCSPGEAAVDAANRQGETALIVADPEAPRRGRAPLARGGRRAPTRTDNAGLSARDYAARDRRSAEMLKLIEAVKPKPVFVAGPVIQ